MIDERSSSFSFDDDAAFTFVYKRQTSSGQDAITNVPAYDPSQYGGSSGPLAITGMLSGSYYDPARAGEGVLLEVGAAGTRKVLFLTWYTYFQGQQRWIVGNVDFPVNATSITVPLLITSGANFGPDFRASDVMVTSWGSATISFPTCTRMTFAWSNTSGQSGTYNYQRLVDGLDGVSCP